MLIAENVHNKILHSTVVDVEEAAVELNNYELTDVRCNIILLFSGRIFMSGITLYIVEQQSTQ